MNSNSVYRGAVCWMANVPVLYEPVLKINGLFEPAYGDTCPIAAGRRAIVFSAVESAGP